MKRMMWKREQIAFISVFSCVEIFAKNSGRENKALVCSFFFCFSRWILESDFIVCGFSGWRPRDLLWNLVNIGKWRKAQSAYVSASVNVFVCVWELCKEYYFYYYHYYYYVYVASEVGSKTIGQIALIYLVVCKGVARCGKKCCTDTYTHGCH